jgi:peptide/nickel transport system substrate-binding protein
MTVMLATAIAAVGVTACGSGSGSSGVAATQASTLTLYEPSPPTSLNPAQSQGPVDAPVVDLAYGNLFYQVSPTNYKPEIAKSFRYVGTGNREIEIVLRPDVHFSDGTLLTSKLEAQTIEYSIKAGSVGPSQFPLQRITTPNSTTLDIYFSQAFPFAEAEFSQQGGVASPISLKGMQTKAIGYETFGAGAYQLEPSQTTAGSTYTFVKNPHYFDPAQQRWDSVVLKVLSNTNSAIQAASANGSSYVAGTVLNNAAAKSAGLRIASAAATKSYGLLIADRLGKLVPALGNVKVRQALNYAGDRTQGATALDGTPLEQLNDPGFVGHYSADIYSYNVAEAKSLLAAAGYPHGFTFTALVNGTDGTSVQTAQFLVAEFQKIGVTMNLVTAPTENTFVSDMFAMKYAADIDQMPGNVLAFVQATLFPGGFWNFFHDPAPSPGFIADYNAASTLDGSAAYTAWAALMRQVQQNYVWLVNVAAVAPSYYSSQNVIVPSSLGITPDPLYFEKS